VRIITVGQRPVATLPDGAIVSPNFWVSENFFLGKLSFKNAKPEAKTFIMVKFRDISKFLVPEIYSLGNLQLSLRKLQFPVRLFFNPGSHWQWR